MPRTRTALLVLPIALAGLGVGVAVQATQRVRDEQRRLVELAVEGREAGQEFVDTLQGEHAERQRLAFDQRRTLALALAAARRDRLLGLLAAAGAALVAGAMWVLQRISEEVEEDRRHVAQEGGEPPPPA